MTTMSNADQNFLQMREAAVLCNRWTGCGVFIFMASVLAAAGLIEELFDVVYQILGGLKGGLATATIIASTILAAMVGVIGAAEVTMGIIFRSAVPFLFLQSVGLALVVIFPEIILWLPKIVYGGN